MTCRYTKTRNGNTARVNTSGEISDQTAAALEAVIDVAAARLVYPDIDIGDDLVLRLRPRYEDMPTISPCDFYGVKPCPHCKVDISGEINDDGDNPVTCVSCGREFLIDLDDAGQLIHRALRSPADVKFLETIEAQERAAVSGKKDD